VLRHQPGDAGTPMHLDAAHALAERSAPATRRCSGDQQAGLAIDNERLSRALAPSSSRIRPRHNPGGALAGTQKHWRQLLQLRQQSADVAAVRCSRRARLKAETPCTQPNDSDTTTPPTELDSCKASLMPRKAELARAREERLVSHESARAWFASHQVHWTGVRWPATGPLNINAALPLSPATCPAGTWARKTKACKPWIGPCVWPAAAGLNRADAPSGVFLLVGPSGRGLKTKRRWPLADLLYGERAFLTTIKHVRFQEKPHVSRLIGAPPYVRLWRRRHATEAVRQKTLFGHLLDEVEKSDPDVMNVFYQIFEQGRRQ